MYIKSTVLPAVYCGKSVCFLKTFVTSSGKTRFMQMLICDKKVQALIRCCAFCAASVQSLDFFVTYEHLQKTLFSLSTPHLVFPFALMCHLSIIMLITRLLSGLKTRLTTSITNI